MIRYKVKFKDGSSYSLFGADYFGDKRVFWEYHQSNLIGFCAEVCEKGTPIEVFDTQSEASLKFEGKEEFEKWFFEHQASKPCDCYENITDNQSFYKNGKRAITELKDFLSKEMDSLKTKPFNPWSLDGGYKFIRMKSQLGLASIRKIKKAGDRIEIDQQLMDTLISVYDIPSQSLINGFSLLNYTNQKHENIDPQDLIKLLELNLTSIIEYEKKFDLIYQGMN